MNRAAVLLAVIACGARPRVPTATDDQAPLQLLLYRDRALVVHRIVVDVPPSGLVTTTLPLATGAAPEEVFVIGPRQARIAQRRAAEPASVELSIRAPRGRVAVRLGYTTDRLAWDAAYTLTTTSDRERGLLRGSLAIRNTTGSRSRMRGSPSSMAITSARSSGRRATARREPSHASSGAPM